MDSFMNTFKKKFLILDYNFSKKFSTEKNFLIVWKYSFSKEYTLLIIWIVLWTPLQKFPTSDYNRIVWIACMSARKRKISFESLILRENIIFQVLLSVSKKKKFLTSDCNSSKEYLDRRTERPLLILLLPQIGKFRSSFIERRVVRKKSSISIHHSSNNNFSRMNRRFILFEEEIKIKKKKKERLKSELDFRYILELFDSFLFFYFFIFFWSCNANLSNVYTFTSEGMDKAGWNRVKRY